MNFNTPCITLHSGRYGKYGLHLYTRKGSHFFLCWVSQCELQITTTPLPCPPLCLLDFHAWIHLHWLKEKSKEMIKTFLLVQPHALFPSTLHRNSISFRHQWQGTAKPFHFEFQTFQLLLFSFNSTFLVAAIWKDCKNLKSRIFELIFINKERITNIIQFFLSFFPCEKIHK